MDVGVALADGAYASNHATAVEGRVADVLTAIPLKLIRQDEIASCDNLPLGPNLRVVLLLRFGAKHRSQPFAFGCGSHAISSRPALQINVKQLKSVPALFWIIFPMRTDLFQHV
jgi:hypothetical protein